MKPLRLPSRIGVKNPESCTQERTANIIPNEDSISQSIVNLCFILQIYESYYIYLEISIKYHYL